jgi:mannose/fructose/N-acetylgalactosamine-specific phosphotransferase system component IIB
MNVLLYRVDDRLIHGQVILGWGRRLSPRRILVVDDRIAGDAWERELLAAAAPPEIAAEFLTVGAAARALENGARGDETAARGGQEPAFVLMESPASALALAEAGFVIPDLNLGGLHRPGGLQVTPYLFLLPEDLAALRGLAVRGTRIYAQDLPDGKRVDARALRDGPGA